MPAPRLRAVRRVVVALALVAGATTLGPSGQVAPSPEQSCQNPTRRMHLYAEELPPYEEGPRIGWGLAPGQATIPGPTIQMLEGECLSITVHNDVPAETLEALRQKYGGHEADPLGVSLHVHGVKYTQASDGTQQTNSIVPPGRSRTYKWFAEPRVEVAGRIVSQGTAGYWWYHDHVVGTDHGSGGLDTGLWGALIVRRAGDLKPDRTFVVGMGTARTINLRRYPDTDACDPAGPVPSNTCLVAKQGERVEFAVIGFGDEFHTFHLHGHTWADNRTGILQSHLDDTPLIDNKTLGPADTFGFQVIAGQTVGAGNWMLHCHVQLHSDRGMVTFFHVLQPDGTMVPQPAMNMTYGHRLTS